MGSDDRAVEPGRRSPDRWWTFGAVLPAVLLASVAVRQIHLARTADLTPWKGGGFGMFSTTDGLPQRSVLAIARAPDRSEELDISDDVRSLLGKAAALPGDTELETLARAIVEREREAGRPLTALDLVVRRTRYSPLTLFATTESLRKYTFTVDDGG